jgi:UDP-N-acetylmuramoyl-tripeptide--D-alanyl-D-alanine ligase
VRATDVALDWPRGTRFRLLCQGRSREVRTRLFGRHHVYPILAAVAVGLALGLDPERTLPALERLAPSRGRLQLVALADGVELLRDDHKSTLETVERALDLLAEIPDRRRLVVMGEVSEPPGSQGPLYRGLGARVAAIAAGLVVVGGNFQRYAAGATAAGMPRDRIVDAGRDVLAAAAAVRAMQKPGDVVLVKGRDTQHLARVALALGGRPVRCAIPECSLKVCGCDDCPMLERGWRGRRPVEL